MKKNNIKTYFIAIGCMLMTVCLLLGVLFIPKANKIANAEKQSLVMDAVWEEDRMIGTSFSIPDAKIKTETGLLDVTKAYVVYPNGEAYIKDSYDLTQGGEYTVWFCANDVTLSKKFKVYHPYISLSGIGNYAYLDQLKMTDEAVSGVTATLVEGSELKFNKVVDISSADLNTPIATVYPYNFTEREGRDGHVIEANIIVVRITDAYAPENYVDVEISYDVDSDKLDENGYSRYGRYFRAGTSKSKIIGLGPTNKTSDQWREVIQFEGSNYIVYEKPENKMSPYGPYGKSDSSSLGISSDNSPNSIYFDSATNKIYVGDKLTKHFVTDLDSELVYDVPFSGFTTGEVYISVRADWYMKSEVSIEVSDVYGMSGDEFSQKYAIDDKNPWVVPALSNQEDGTIVVIQNETVYLPDYQTLDVSGIQDSFVRVYYNYGLANQSFVGVVDNTFVPKNVGVYTLVYGATDVYGNYSEKELALNCISSDKKESLRLEFKKATDSLDLKEGETPSVPAGQVHTLPENIIENENAFEVNLEVYAYKKGEEDSKIFVNTENNNIVFDDFGEYVLVYEYGDKFQQKRKEFSFNAISSSAVILEGTPALNDYYILGATYTFDDCKVKCFDKEEVYLDDAQLFMRNDENADWVECDFRKVTITANDTVQFEYRYKGTVLYTSVAKKVVDVGYNGALKMDQYFVGDFTATPDAKMIRYISKQQVGNNTLTFINPISFDSFAFNYQIIEEYRNFTSLTIQLVDFYNRENVLDIIFGATEAGSYYQINDKICQLERSANLLSSIEYDEISRGFKFFTGDTIAYNSQFSSDKVLLNITLNGIFGESAIDITSLNYQGFSNKKFENNGANFKLLDIEGERKIGSVITVNRPYISDVLTPFMLEKFKMTAIAPDGKYCNDINTGVALQNVSIDQAQINLSMYGKYTITYFYADAFGNESRDIVEVFVTDDVLPTFTLEGEYENSTQYAKVGDEVKIASYSAADNHTSNEELRITIMLVEPNGRVSIIEQDTFIPNTTGVYRLYYTCYDTAGNYVTAQYYVSVS